MNHPLPRHYSRNKEVVFHHRGPLNTGEPAVVAKATTADWANRIADALNETDPLYQAAISQTPPIEEQAEPAICPCGQHYTTDEFTHQDWLNQRTSRVSYAQHLAECQLPHDDSPNACHHRLSDRPGTITRLT